jgi:hypothetical protein
VPHARAIFDFIIVTETEHSATATFYRHHSIMQVSVTLCASRTKVVLFVAKSFYNILSLLVAGQISVSSKHEYEASGVCFEASVITW